MDVNETPPVVDQASPVEEDRHLPKEVHQEDRPLPKEVHQEDRHIPKEVHQEDRPLPKEVHQEDRPLPKEVHQENRPLPNDVHREEQLNIGSFTGKHLEKMVFAIKKLTKASLFKIAEEGPFTINRC